MHSGLRFIAVSTALAVSAGAGVAAEAIKCGTTDSVTHRESDFHFINVSPKWRVAVGSNPCSQVLYTFLPIDSNNKSGNDFVAEYAGTVKPVPGCQAAGLTPQENLFGGQIEVYCSTINGNQPVRWASIAIWIKSPGYYGAAYSVITANTSPNTKPAFTGVGVDPITQNLDVKINMIAEQ